MKFGLKKYALATLFKKRLLKTYSMQQGKFITTKELDPEENKKYLSVCEGMASSTTNTGENIERKLL